MIFEHALAAHGIPEDPRVFVPVESEPGGSRENAAKERVSMSEISFCALSERGVSNAELLHLHRYLRSLAWI